MYATQTFQAFLQTLTDPEVVLQGLTVSPTCSLSLTWAIQAMRPAPLKKRTVPGFVTLSVPCHVHGTYRENNVSSVDRFEPKSYSPIEVELIVDHSLFIEQ